MARLKRQSYFRQYPNATDNDYEIYKLSCFRYEDDELEEWRVKKIKELTEKKDE